MNITWLASMDPRFCICQVMVPCPVLLTYSPCKERSVSVAEAGVGVGVGEGEGEGEGAGTARMVVVTLALPEPGTAKVRELPAASSTCIDELLVTVALTVSTIPTATVPPAGTLPSVQVTGAVVVQEPWLGIADASVAAAAEKSSVTITCATALLPLLVTRISYPTVEFAGAEVGPLMVTARFAGAGGDGGTGAAGVTAFEGAEFALEPAALAALTTKVYVVPFVRPTNVVLAPGAATCTVNPVGVPLASADTV